MQYKYTSKDIERFWSKVDKSGGEDACWIWTGCTGRGYGQIKWGRGMIVSHRIVWILTYGDIPNSLLVLHKCDNPPCVNPQHLFLGTQSDNMKDMFHKKRRDMHGKRGENPNMQGEKNPLCKLTDLQVVEIRQRYKWYGKGGENQLELAHAFGVDQALICRIVNHKR